ncbi:MAG: tetratricopeptide repeat protein [Tindallia sp. MSAO_Bac2]|nr:MAG: tetratricopeptide repeat protein [Tindallia sp. MSAO_Bac2]
MVDKIRKENRMPYYIFSSNSREREETVKKLLKINQNHDIRRVWAEYNNDRSHESRIKGILSLKCKNTYRGIPGYWVKIESDSNDYGKQTLLYLHNIIGIERINDNVFYPKTALSFKELESEWQKKYRFKNGNQHPESYRIFFKEIKMLMSENQLNNAYYGLILLLQTKSGFLKKYNRYTILEDLAFRLDQEGDFDRAERCLRLQRKVMPDSSFPALNISNLYLLNGMSEKAVRVLRSSLKKHPNDQYLMHNYIMALSNEGNYHLAVATLKKILEKDINNSFYWKLLADLFYETEDLQTAIKCYRKALYGDIEEIQEDIRADIYFGMAACFYETNQYKKAKQYYLKVLKTFPEDHYTLMNVSQICFHHLDEPEEALKYAKIVEEKGSDNGYIHYQLGLIYMALEIREKAKWHLYKARRMIPYFQPVHEALHQLRSLENKTQKLTFDK